MMETMCIFPGQGSQSVGMLSELATTYPVVKQTFEEASEVLGFDLWVLASAGPQEDLDQTENTQPALLAASTACWRVLRSQTELAPSIMAGHSFGEYSALVAAGAIDYSAAVSLARNRGQIMQAAVPAGSGAMAAVLGLEDGQLQSLCEAQSTSEQCVEAVNFNAPGQVVIAGHRTAVEALTEAAKQAGAKRALILPVSVPAHSSLMRPAAEKFKQKVAAVVIQNPAIDVLQNADNQAHHDQETIAAALCEQLYRPVRWVEAVQSMRARGCNFSLEIGPGKVLTGLNKRIDKSINSICVCDQNSLEQAVNALEGNS